MVRKCSFRFMFVDKDKNVHVVTQDMRRRRSIVTGHTVPYKALFSPPLQDWAKANGCSVLLYEKGARP